MQLISLDTHKYAVSKGANEIGLVAHPDLLYSGYRAILGGKASGAWP